VNASPVTAQEGADSDRVCLTTAAWLDDTAPSRETNATAATNIGN